MSDGQDISLQGAYRQDQGAKLEVKPTEFDLFTSVAPFFTVITLFGVYKYMKH